MATFFRGLMILLLLVNPFLGFVAILLAFAVMSIPGVASAIAAGMARRQRFKVVLQTRRRKKISGISRDEDEDEPHAA